MLKLQHNDWTSLLYLRGILAAYVLFHHIRNIHLPRVSGLEGSTPLYEKGLNIIINITGNFGLQAVLAFFVISGISIYAGYKPEAGVRTFYFRRFKRLYPVLAFSVLTTYLFSLFYPVTYSWQNLIATLTMCNGILLGGSFAGNSPYWSLSCEAWYYLFAPLIFALMKNRIGTISLILFALFIPLWKGRDLAVLMHFISWLTGALIIKQTNAEKLKKGAMIGLLFLSLGLATIPCLVLDFMDMQNSTLFLYVCLLMGIPCGGAVLALLYLLRDLPLNIKCLRFLGDISYSLYLVHYPILIFVNHLFQSESFAISYLLKPTLSTILSITVAFICFRFIEKPLMPKRPAIKK